MRAFFKVLSCPVPAFLVLGLSAQISLGATAIDDADLYSATTFVTGQREETRVPGIKATFASVLVKVTGATKILERKAFAAYAAKAGDYVSGYGYRDRMEGIPHHDEQGSRDRPYDLTVHFVPAKIDGIIKELGFRKWALPRPIITPLVKVEFQGSSFFMTRDAEKGVGQRDALLAEAEKLGMAVALPHAATLDGMDVGPPNIEGPSQAALESVAEQTGGDTVLSCVLVWDAEKLVWNSSWRIMVGGQARQWQEATETFDGAFRAGLGGAAALLSRVR
ncbi:hypothetical protein C8N35_106241 [Breoghania corrubedonensis]|uniref:DUF2066 domain-containing protein n=1 Tax=Breoghania corrubedonensis TaxID=665038 RepID=A0A2T5V7Y5_9HYPH|nr:DUF2066 domain-containing protein [Breoghania corrubedonensis]PTW59856.1 hypothetical protein C8N35_106241 [Breoghania corrubedonensis]